MFLDPSNSPRKIPKVLVQWPFQEPKLEVPTIYKAYFSGLCFREYPQKNMAKHMVRLRTSINWILKISHWLVDYGEKPL